MALMVTLPNYEESHGLPTTTMKASHGSHGDPTRPGGVSWALGQIMIKKAPPTPTMTASHGSHGDPTRL